MLWLLEQFSVDLTAQAQDDKLDPIIGRHDEIRRCLQILARRSKNNPILIGEAGVGKTGKLNFVYCTEWTMNYYTNESIGLELNFGCCTEWTMDMNRLVSFVKD